MSPQLSTNRVTFENGLDEASEPTQIPKGFLQECINWQPESNGGLRCRPKWFKGSEDSAPDTRRCKGMGLFQRFTEPKIVQMASVYTRTTPLTSGTPAVPSLVWALPTQPGNILVAIVTGAFFSPTTLALSMTAESWTTQLAIDGPQTQGVPFVGVYELITSTVFQGTVTPFSITGSASSSSGFLQVRIIELSGVSEFDQIAEATAHSGAGTGDFGVTVTGVSTLQASELMLAVGASTVQNQAAKPSGSAYTLDTASTGWTKYTETSQSWIASSSAYPSAWTVWSKVASAVETPSIVITETATGSHSAADADAVFMTYKGWNDDPAPGEQVDMLLAAHDNTATYDIYSISRATVDVDTWTLLDAAIGDSTSGAPVSFALGLGAAWYTAPSFTGLRRLETGTGHYVAASPGNARSVTFHRDRIWAASGSRLSFSQIGDGNTWPNSSDNTGSGYFDVNLDDGENIECVAPHAGFLVVGKRTSTYVITGRDAEEFSLEPLPGGDCAPGQSIVSTPFGCVIAGRRMVYILGSNASALTIATNTLRIEPLGRAIEASYSVGTDEFVWCDYADSKVFITVGTAGKTFVYNFETKAWSVEMVDDGTVEAPAVTFSYDDIQYYGPVAGVVSSLANFRQYPHGTRGKDFDTLQMQFSAQTGDIPIAGVRRPITPRHLFMQVRQRTGADDETGLTVTPVFDGELGEACEVAAGNIMVRREVVSGFEQQAGTGINTVGVRIEQVVPSGESITFDIEDMFIDFIPEEARA